MIREATEVSDELVRALGALVRQLSRSAPEASAEELRAIASSPATRLLVAWSDDGEVLGMLTLAIFRIPTGVRAWIEDVVVDEAARGRGLGAELTREAARLAFEAGARTVDLTSRPDREAANRLYTRLGFHKRETNVYRLEQ